MVAATTAPAPIKQEVKIIDKAPVQHEVKTVQQQPAAPAIQTFKSTQAAPGNVSIWRICKNSSKWYDSSSHLVLHILAAQQTVQSAAQNQGFFRVQAQFPQTYLNAGSFGDFDRGFSAGFNSFDNFDGGNSRFENFGGSSGFPFDAGVAPQTYNSDFTTFGLGFQQGSDNANGFQSFPSGPAQQTFQEARPAPVQVQTKAQAPSPVPACAPAPAPAPAVIHTPAPTPARPIARVHVTKHVQYQAPIQKPDQAKKVALTSFQALTYQVPQSFQAQTYEASQPFRLRATRMMNQLKGSPNLSKRFHRTSFVWSFQQLPLIIPSGLRNLPQFAQDVASNLQLPNFSQGLGTLLQQLTVKIDFSRSFEYQQAQNYQA